MKHLMKNEYQIDQMRNIWYGWRGLERLSGLILADLIHDKICSIYVLIARLCHVRGTVQPKHGFIASSHARIVDRRHRYHEWTTTETSAVPRYVVYWVISRFGICTQRLAPEDIKQSVEIWARAVLGDVSSICLSHIDFGLGSQAPSSGKIYHISFGCCHVVTINVPLIYNRFHMRAT